MGYQMDSLTQTLPKTLQNRPATWATDKGRMFARLHYYLACRRMARTIDPALYAHAWWAEWGAKRAGLVRSHVHETFRDIEAASRREGSACYEPADFQDLHEIDGMPALVSVPGQIADDKGRASAPSKRRRTPLEVMLVRGTIDDGQYEAGMQFAAQFAKARFESLRACDLLRQPGSGWRDVSDGVLDAKDQVYAVLKKLGGEGPIMSEAVWQVIGQEVSIKEFCKTMSLRDHAALNPQKVTGLLLGALTVMAAHYGTTRYGDRARVERPDHAWSVPA